MKSKDDKPEETLVCTNDARNKKPINVISKSKYDNFKLLFEKSVDPALLLDVGGNCSKFIDCNEATLKLMKYFNKSQIIGHCPEDISPEKQPDGSASLVKANELIGVALRKGFNRFEWQHCGSDGSAIWVDVTLTVIPVRDKRVMYTVWRNIGEYKETEAKLKESEERYRVAIDNSNDGFAIVNGHRYVYANRRLLEMLGYPSDYDIGREKPVFFVHPDDRSLVMSYIIKRQTGEPTPKRYEFRAIRLDKTVINIEVSVTGITYFGERVSLACFRDITERKQIEKELHESEEKYRELFENAAEGIFQTSPEGSLVCANPAFARMFGYNSPKEIMKDISDIGQQMYANPQDRAKIKAVLEKYNAVKDYEVEFIDINGHKIWISVNAHTRRNNSGKILCYQGTMIDITERKQAQAALTKKELELWNKSSSLEETNIALKVLLRQREEDRASFEDTIVGNFKKLVVPYIEKLKCGRLTDNQQSYLDMMDSNLNNIFSPLLQKMTLKCSFLTPTEIQIADLIRKGRTSKEMAGILNLSKCTIDTHRNNIRKKLSLNKRKVNLQNYLASLEK